MPFTMERREHYDPEDIENLLQERGYDELLEEERAYVLRHLSGREEYEAMRTLLLQVREDDRRMEPLTLDPSVRENVMAAFRAQQRPQWQVWLNSVGTLLWPKEAAAMWRPALAFATLALLIVAGVQLMRTGPDAVKQQQVAEMRPKPVKGSDFDLKSDSFPSARAAEGASQSEAVQPRASLQEEAEMESAADEAPVQELMKDAMAEPASAERESLADDAAAPVDRMDKEAESRPESIAVHEMAARARKEAVSVAPVSTGSAASHAVTADELSTNMTIANASTRSPAYAFRTKNDARTDLADSPEILALLTTGW